MVFDNITSSSPALPPPPVEDAVGLARARLGFEPDEVQAAVLRSSTKRGILNCTRQWGKSTVSAAKAVHRAYTVPGSLTIVASPSDRQSGEFLRKAAEMLRRLGVRPRGDGHNNLSLQLPNGSRIVGLPGVEETARGFSQVSLMIIDEASRVPDAIYKMLCPMLAVGDGDLWLISTPNERVGFFHAVWEFGGAEWERFRVQATDCARISKTFLEEQRAQMGREFEREYMCEFLDLGGTVFARELVERALDDEVLPLAIDE